MANFNPAASGYIDVASRIAEFRAKHPEGSLQPADPSKPFEIVTIGQDVFVVVVAAAYRSADDQRPGIGMAYEPYPGRTPYTRGSELQNAETSAWGRAIVAALAADTNKGVASYEEVRNRSAERQQPVASQPVASREELIKLVEAASNTDSLRAVWRAMNESHRAGAISGQEKEQVDAAITERRANLPPEDAERHLEAVAA